MTTPNKVNTKNFDKKLSSVIGRSKTARTDLQDLLTFGLAFYGGDSQDTTYLNKCVKACVGIGSLDTRKMREYVQEHANVAWTKIEIKTGVNKGKADHVFKKRGEHSEVTMPTAPWYEFEKETVEKPPIDALVKLNNFRKMIAKEIADNHVTDVEMARRILGGIDFELAALKEGTELKAVA